MSQLAFTWPGNEDHLDMVNDRAQVIDMERRTYDCGTRPAFHPPHDYERDGAEIHCSGLVWAHCGAEGKHTHHRWAKPEEFFWCEGIPHELFNR
jgi:hypothetical protein